METTSQAVAQAPAVEGGQHVPSARRTVDGYLQAPFPWYGLDEAFTGPRWLMQVGTAADGAVEHGSIGHGDAPSVKNEVGGAGEPREKFAVVVTVAANPSRRSADGTGLLEATSVSSAAWLAGVGLLTFTWPGQMDHTLRDDWLEQQTETAWALADDLDGYSAADCVALLRESALTAMRRSIAAADVTAADVAAARATVRPSLQPEQVASLRAFAEGR